MLSSTYFDCAIAGGGLAGLTLAIQLAEVGHSVVLFEKEKYPFHKVCGEYISMESSGFLERIGLPLSAMSLPFINQVKISSPNGTFLQQPLDLGGFGISRHTLDHALASLAKQKGVTVLEETSVTDIQFDGQHFYIQTSDTTFTAKVAIGAFGKKSNLDKVLGRATPSMLNKKKNYVGVKYHLKLDFPANRIELHNFKDGYAGISKVDDDKYCLCYLTTAHNLNLHQNDIKLMERKVLMQNPFLKRYFSEAEFLYDKPLAISQVTFQKKSAVENRVLLLGDAAGTIAPLCGNGMSMAMHASFLAAGLVHSFLTQQTSRHEMEAQYAQLWNTNFASRITIGRTLQHLFGGENITNLAIGTLKHLPWATNALIGLTHGKVF
jgi:menaquinone-9 beta-reductase